MKEHLSKLVALTFVFVSASASSQTLNWSSLTGSQIVDSQGDALDNTYVFELGAFDVGFTPNDSNLGTWGSKWHVFDTASYSNNAQDGGYFTGTENLQNVANYGSLFQGLTAYIWIRNTSNTEYFLASASAKPAIAEWKFQDLDPDCCANGEVTTWSVSNLDTDTPVWGSQLDHHSAGVFDGTGGPYDLQTHVVPEPSVSLLALLAGGLCLVRRRKQA
jgi:hypothetical protein